MVAVWIMWRVVISTDMEPDNPPAMMVPTIVPAMVAVMVSFPVWTMMHVVAMTPMVVTVMRSYMPFDVMSWVVLGWTRFI